MNQEQLQGNWQQLKTKFHEKWDKLTESDLLESQGKAEALINKITERYGIDKEKAAKKFDKFLKKLEEAESMPETIANNLSEMTENLNEKAQGIANNLQKFAKEKPITTLGIIAAVGAVLGALISRS